MGSETSARLAMPLLAAGQAQKEMTHNEALAMLDIAVQARVAAAGVNDPPADPAIGACWIVGDAPTGAWADQAGTIAGWTSDGWRFVVPVEGLAAWVGDQAVAARWLSGAWVIGDLAGSRVSIGGTQVLGAQAAAIADPGGGTTIDTEARAALAGILTALRGHGLIAT